MLMGCLSRMRGNLHVRFLGEGVAARPPPYPTRDEGSTPSSRSSTDYFVALAILAFRNSSLSLLDVFRAFRAASISSGAISGRKS